MMKNYLFLKLVVSLTLVGFALLVIQTQCENDPHKALDRKMKKLFKDEQLRNTISNYLDKVPSSHKSRAHANRCFSMTIKMQFDPDHDSNSESGSGHFSSYKHHHKHPSHSKIKNKWHKKHHHDSSYDSSSSSDETTTKSGAIRTQKADDYDNNIKDVLNLIMSSSEADCKACDPCPTLPDCTDCEMIPGPVCDVCPPCPISSLCPPPSIYEKCPPKPVCELCGSTSTTKAPAGRSSTTKKTEGGSTSTTMKPNESTRKSLIAKATTVKPNETTTREPLSTTSVKPTKTPTTTAAATTTTTTTKRSSNIKTTSTTAKSDQTTAEKSSQESGMLKEHSDQDDRHHSSEHEEGAANWKLDRRVIKSTNTTTKTTKDGIVSYVKTTSVSTNITGSWLFETSMNRLVSNQTLREQIIKMINETPEFAGGEEMDLANQILGRLGSKQLKPIKKKGSNRSFTYRTARNNVKEILGHILYRYSREKCSCPECKIPKLCECKRKSTCPPQGKKVCKPCSQVAPPNCPAPEGCKEYPPCKKCKPDKEIDPNDDGDPKDLDDLDTENTLKEGELELTTKCKGFSCAYEKTCGTANLNPLTPKGSQSGYMVGGIDQVYGEWPHFVRINIIFGSFSGLCGGVLISNKQVLTAGHCVIEPWDGKEPQVFKRIPLDAFQVTLADHDRHSKDEFEETRKVSSVCYSSKFNDPHNEGARYDFAVLTLDKNVTFSDHIQPACLPYKPLPKKPKCFVIGLGITKFSRSGNHNFAEHIQKMPLVRASCRNWGIKHDDRSRHCFTKAKAPGDTCGGDSGGPVLCLSSTKRWTVNGLVSYGSETCDGSESSGWVAVYTRIPALLSQLNQDCKI